MGNLFTKKCKLCNIEYNKNNSCCCRISQDKNEYFVIDNKKYYYNSHQYEGIIWC